MAAGQSNPEIAATLYVSVKTVEANLTRIYRKLGLRSRVDLARRPPQLSYSVRVMPAGGMSAHQPTQPRPAIPHLDEYDAVRILGLRQLTAR